MTDYNASMMRLGGLVLKHSALPFGVLGYNCQMQKLVLLSPDRAPAKFSEVASPATGRLLVVVARINAGRWI